jgi:hypothetical protein
MNSFAELKIIKYGEIFEQELSGLQRRRSADPLCTVKDIEKTLKNIYIREGADIQGRGQMQDIIIAATIAAHELFITQWKAEAKNG